MTKIKTNTSPHTVPQKLSPKMTHVPLIKAMAIRPAGIFGWPRFLFRKHLKECVTHPIYESRVNWVVDPSPPASCRPATGASPAPTSAIFMPSSGAPSQPPPRQKSRRRRRRKAKRSANHNSASRQADLAIPAERSANDNSARRRATQPRSAANDLPEMKSTPLEHPHSFTSSLLTQPPISAANHNAGISSRRDHPEFLGLYKPAQSDPRHSADCFLAVSTSPLFCSRFEIANVFWTYIINKIDYTCPVSDICAF